MNAMFSVIVTIRNEVHHIADLLDSLVVQDADFEIVVVDAGSTDGTLDVLKRYTEKYDFIRVYDHGGTRGEGRNYGAEKAEGDVLAFTDGDCIANPFWLKEFGKTLKKSDIVAGRTVNIGYLAFSELERVELYHKGTDITYPSCNLAYKKDVFFEAGGFDPWFITAEDIDLNYRAIDLGYRIEYNPNAIIYHRARDTFFGFFKQAFWNGYGRKQLTLKHGRLWGKYKPGEMFRRKVTAWHLIRLGVAVLGYLACKMKEKEAPTQRA